MTDFPPEGLDVTALFRENDAGEKTLVEPGDLQDPAFLYVCIQELYSRLQHLEQTMVTLYDEEGHC